MTFMHIVGETISKKYPAYQQALINITKQQFIVLISFVLSWMNPCKMSIYWDSLPEGNLFKNVDGFLVSSLSPNTVIMANHQLYTDWLFIWYLTYTARMSDLIYIILKDMSGIPILGRGMKTFNFLYLSRKWENDKIVLTNQLLLIDANARGLGPANGVSHVASANARHLINEGGKSVDIVEWPKGENPNEIWPYTLVVFPEGTVPSLRTTKRSREFIASKGYPPLNHVLLPRVRGLFLTLRKLRNTVEFVYDITTGYSGVKEDEFGEDIFTLKQTYLLGNGPRSVHHHFRSYKLSDIPLGVETLDVDDARPEDLAAFENWLNKAWGEKDVMMDTFYKTGKFESKNLTVGEMKLRNRLEVLPAFIPLFGLVIVLRLLWIGARAIFA